MLRASNPADLLSLLVLQAKPLPVVACGRHSLASGRGDTLPWGEMVEEWLLDRGRCHTRVLSRRGGAVALVSCSRYKSAATWEIDLLQIAQGKDWALVEMMDDLGVHLGKKGVESLVLRLDEESTLHSVAAEAGFTPLQREKLYVRPPGPLLSNAALQEDDGHRPSSEADVYQLFKLYCSSIPAPVRRMEGLTLAGWQSAPAGGGLLREKRWVLEREGQVTAAVTMVRGNGKRRLLEVLTNPREAVPMDGLVAEAVKAEGAKSTLVTLLPEYFGGACGVEKVIVDFGFQESATLTVYSKPLVARVRSVGMLPARA